jgi:ribosomal protein L16 Arg81 hydroxylase
MQSIRSAADQISLPDEWRKWIATSRMLGLDHQSLVRVLVENGVNRRVAAEEVDATDGHPYFQAGHWIAQKLRKAQSLLGVYADLAALRPSADGNSIERRSELSRAEFLDRYYAANRPVVLTEMMKDWRALALWSPEYFKATCGSESVEVMSDRDSDSNYEVNCESHKTTMRFRDYIDRVSTGGASNDCYMVANNHSLQRQGMRHLLSDIVAFPEYLDPASVEGGVFLWFGPEGTLTPLHHDVLNVLMAQVLGRKHVTLVPSNQLHYVYNEMGVYSEVDCEKPDLRRFPAFECTRRQSVVLNPGEALFIPVGWWHHVRALDVSVTVSFSNFLFPNRYEWSHPSRY